MEALALYTGAPTVHCEDNKFLIYVVKNEGITPRVKQIDIAVCLIQE